MQKRKARVKMYVELSMRKLNPGLLARCSLNKSPFISGRFVIKYSNFDFLTEFLLLTNVVKEKHFFFISFFDLNVHNVAAELAKVYCKSV